jgi:hypothetical protein
LENINVISRRERDVLIKLISLLNQAVHGAEVTPEGAYWAIDVGENVLNSLNNRYTHTE